MNFLRRTMKIRSIFGIVVAVLIVAKTNASADLVYTVKSTISAGGTADWTLDGLGGHGDDQHDAWHSDRRRFFRLHLRASGTSAGYEPLSFTGITSQGQVGGSYNVVFNDISNSGSDLLEFMINDSGNGNSLVGLPTTVPALYGRTQQWRHGVKLDLLLLR